jgi:electron transfer flavoprotein beta subunit
MKIFVIIKQVPDTETKIQVKADGSGIEESGIKWVMNPYDEFAVEEALKLRDSKGDSTVTVLSVGPKTRVVDSLRTALAMGADDAIIVDTTDTLDSFLVAKAISGAVQKEGGCDILFAGKLAIDDNCASVGQMVAEFLKIPHMTVVSKFSINGDKIQVEREVEGGSREIYEITGPCVIAANKGLNTPRYASLPGIMKAKKKPVKELTLADVGVQANQIKVKFKNFKVPPEKAPVKMLAGDAATQAKELVRLLMEESKVL